METNDFTAKVNLSILPTSEQIFYRVSFQDLSDTKIYSVPIWEFVSGLLNSETFGLVVKYQSVKVEDKASNFSPSKG
ncbi:hypothetical protein [Okeania sp.]|uniref:hypothetical protein n=1 Tax=Okeania sp. TaxID=3100323 RepID=UPI002B4B6F88|nr:hypothetical protein [Okeania sp.]MEB3339702.1 hypothetical protein [Okeania sp.]